MKENIEAVIEIDKADFDEINGYLKDGEDIRVYGLEEDSTLLSLEANFENGYMGVVEVFTGSENVMATAYLYNDKDECVKYIESDVALDEYYDFEIGYKTYTILLEIKK